MTSNSNIRNLSNPSSAAKVLHTLEFLARSQTATVAQIAEALGMPKASVVRNLAVLIEEGYARRVAHGEYQITTALWQLAVDIVDPERLRSQIRPALQELVTQTTETAHYSVYERGRTVYIDKVDGLAPVRAYTQIGHTAPAYATATGKVLLAWQTSAEIAAVGQEAERFTDTTASSEEIPAAAAAVRCAGFAVNKGEWRADVWGVAAPVRDRLGTVIAAVGVSGPSYRFETRLGDLTSAVLATARKLSALAGHVPDAGQGPGTAGSDAWVRHA